MRDSIKKTQLRVHHLLCIPLFRGAGYSGAFAENMAERIRELKKDPEQKVQLVCSSDMICCKCPNRNPDNTCRNGGNHVVQKDRELLAFWGFREGEMYSVEALFREAKEHLTREMFEASCQNCDWYRQGYCSFEEYQKTSFL